MASLIEKLSDDVLLEVFEFLDARTLKSAALVCNNWNDIISLSPSTLKKFTLNLSNVRADNTFWVDKFDDVMRLERKFQAMSVTLNSVLKSSNHPNAVELLKEIVQQHGSQIRKLKLSEAEFQHHKDFSFILSSMPLLEDLEISKTSFSIPKNCAIPKVHLKTLKNLKVDNSSWIAFEYLTGNQITKLVTANTLFRPSQASIIEFLDASKTLESMEIDFKAFVNLFAPTLNKSFPFKLKRFKSHSYMQNEDEQVDSNFIIFLESQASSLKELEINYSSRNVLLAIFTKLTRLEKLRINSRSLPVDKQFYDQLKPIKSLKALESHDEIGVELRSLLGNCPNLEQLKLLHDPNNVISNMLPFMMLYNPKLKALEIDAAKAYLEANVNFKFLEFLHMQNVRNFECLTTFVKCHPTIETLSLEFGDKLQVDAITTFLDTLMNQANLKHLKFTGDFAAMKIIYETIKIDYKNLQSLELINVRDSKSLTFFPKDSNKWNPECEYFNKT